MGKRAKQVAKIIGRRDYKRMDAVKEPQKSTSWLPEGDQRVRTKRKRKSKINDRMLKKYLEQGLTAGDIAKLLGVNESSVYRYIARNNIDYAGIEGYRQERADLLAYDQQDCQTLQAKIRQHWLGQPLNSLKEETIVSIYKALGLDMAVKFDKERLERSKTLGDVRIFTIIYEIADKALFSRDSAIDVTPVVRPEGKLMVENG